MKKYKSRILSMVMVLSMIMTIVPAFSLNLVASAANTIQVTSNADSGAGTLREAIAAAQEGDTIAISTSVENITLLSEIAITVPVTIIGHNSSTVETDAEIKSRKPVISGNNACRIFNYSATSTTPLVIKDIIFSNGTGDNGGAINFVKNYVEVEDCLFLNNSATAYGGAVYLGTADVADIGAFTARRSIFKNNTSVTLGGAIYCTTVTTTTANAYNAYIDRCYFTLNSSANGSAIAVNSGVNANLCYLKATNSTFYGNTGSAYAVYGTGKNSGSTSNLFLGHCSVVNNKKGVLGNYSSGNIKMYNSIDIGNGNGTTADQTGGRGISGTYNLIQSISTTNNYAQVFGANVPTPQGALAPIANGPAHTANAWPLAKQSTSLALYPSNIYTLALSDQTGAARTDTDCVTLGAVEVARRAPINIQVTSNADSGANTFRQAIADALAHDTITFSDDITEIALSTEIALKYPLNFTGNLNADGTPKVVIKPVTATQIRMLNITSFLPVSISNIQFMNGSLAGANGGAITATTDMTFTNCYFTNNVVTATGLGGAVYLSGTDGTFNGCVFNNNMALKGGAIYAPVNTDLLILNSSFIGNQTLGISTSAGGGNAIYTTNNAITAVNSTFMNNTSADAAYNKGVIYGAASTTHFNLFHCTVVNNTNSTSALYQANGSGQIRLQNTIVVGNNDGTLKGNAANTTNNPLLTNSGTYVLGTTAADFATYFGSNTLTNNKYIRPLGASSAIGKAPLADGLIGAPSNLLTLVANDIKGSARGTTVTLGAVEALKHNKTTFYNGQTPISSMIAGDVNVEKEVVNNTGADKNYKLILALYSKDSSQVTKLVKCVSVDPVLLANSGEGVLTASINTLNDQSQLPENAFVIVYLWSNYTGVTPMGDPITLPASL